MSKTRPQSKHGAFNRWKNGGPQGPPQMDDMFILNQK